MPSQKTPKEVAALIEQLTTAGFEAVVVGGCVRDLLLNAKPADWDVATDAIPEEIQRVFPESVYENQFGTVGVKTGSDDPSLAIVEVTTYRVDESYSDQRHPDRVRFTKSLEEDLARRDFTINAIALKIKNPDQNSKIAEDYEIVDPFGGQADLEARLIRAVGEPTTRFREDALRLMRAVRLATQLGFTIEPETTAAIKANARLLKAIAAERIRDELTKLVMADKPALGFTLLKDLELLEYVLPELAEGVGVGQNKHHIYPVFEHSINSLEYAAHAKYSLNVRLAALLHDVGKPKTKRGEGPDSTFYGHEMVGAKMTRQALRRLKFSKDIEEQVTHLVRYHLFYYNVDEVTEAGVRRLVRKVGPEHMADLIKLRTADRKGSGVPKAMPYKLRHLQFLIEKVSRDPLTVGMLNIRGDDIMRILKIDPGPKVGLILKALMDEVLDDPGKNTTEYLEARIAELGALSEPELRKFAQAGEGKVEEFEAGAVAEIKKKHWVQ
ncbi:HD domain-containing protein [Candidatus Parcubacteria bacterium]|nr:HD domain-containing protein [Candidatus Parcubacteria bacterium]